jgi:tripartite-type tricarboxylate transporter receptor subunit TctC
LSRYEYAVLNGAFYSLPYDVVTDFSPVFGEMGLAALYDSDWYGLFAPKGTSRDIISKFNATVMAALADPAVRSRLGDLGMEIFPRERQTPEALAALVKAGAEKRWPIIKEFGIKVG